MIIGKNRAAVIENIKNAAEQQDFYRKVEVDDPVLTAAQSREITDRYISSRKSFGYRFKSFFARRIANIATEILNKDTEIVGEENLPESLAGVLITSNHFGPLENTVIRHFVRLHGQKKLNVISQVTNFAMSGIIGFLMKYGDTIPLSEDFRYLTRDFIDVLDDFMKKGQTVLIYPEQEMWFNYRKPRPLKRGAYHFASKLNVPIVSCFVEIIDSEEKENDEFYKTKYRLHILKTLHPDPQKTVKQNSEELCAVDYELKKAAYERVYGKPLTYNFQQSDIAGWLGDK